MKNWIPHALTLKGDIVTLIPLEQAHKDALGSAAEDGKLWELWFTSVPCKNTIDAYIDHALADKLSGEAFPFAVIDNASGRIIGCTRFYNLQQPHRRLEIGYTWYAKSHQRSGVNTECKLLLLTYAFETLHCIAVQFMTDWFNTASKNAIARLGAKQDGILRNHRINEDGSSRDSVVFSIISQEWIGVKKTLQMMLSRK